MSDKKPKTFKESRAVRARMWRLAQDVTDQHNLDMILIALPNMHARRVAYELIKPMLKFEAMFNEEKYLPPQVVMSVVHDPNDFSVPSQ
jgi:hypothetical protein